MNLMNFLIYCGTIYANYVILYVLNILNKVVVLIMIQDIINGYLVFENELLHVEKLIISGMDRIGQN